MKALFAVLFLFFFLPNLSLKGQDYLSMIEEENRWNVMSVGWIPYWDTLCSTETYRISGDTVLDSKEYKKLYSSWEEIPVQWNLFGLMREDTNGRVWIRENNAPDEWLLYDLSLGVNDSVWVGMIEPVPLQVDSITSVEFGGVVRQKFWMSGLYYPDYKETWTEGMGSSKGIVWSGSGLAIVGGWYRLLCFSRDFEVIWMNPFYSECYYNTVGIGEGPLAALGIYPNPATTFIRIQGSGSGNPMPVVIYDMTGRVVLERVVGPEGCDISSLKPGTYLVKIRYGFEESFQKLVIQK